MNVEPRNKDNFRFWTFVNSAMVQPTLKPGQKLHWSKFERDTEGWSRLGMTWEFDGDVLRHTVVDDGRDCDGPLTQTTVLAHDNRYDGWRLIHDGRETLPVPQWREIESCQRDQYAEAAGF